MQDRLLQLIGERLCHMVGTAVRPGDDIEPEELARFALECARHRVALTGIAVNVKKIGASSL